MKTENALEKCILSGSYLMNRLLEMKNKYHTLKEIRGRGLMMAMEFSEKIDHDSVVSIYERLIEKGFILAKRPKLKVFRIDPPLIIEKKMIDDFIQVLDTILSEF
jgi:4-aminobutyrate aminotransferase-like enzyme